LLGLKRGCFAAGEKGVVEQGGGENEEGGEGKRKQRLEGKGRRGRGGKEGVGFFSLQKFLRAPV